MTCTVPTSQHGSMRAHREKALRNDPLPPFERRGADVQQRVHALLQLQLSGQLPDAPLQPGHLPGQREALAGFHAAQTPGMGRDHR